MTYKGTWSGESWTSGERKQGVLMVLWGVLGFDIACQEQEQGQEKPIKTLFLTKERRWCWKNEIGRRLQLPSAAKFMAN